MGDHQYISGGFVRSHDCENTRGHDVAQEGGIRCVAVVNAVKCHTRTWICMTVAT
jgi:hypothetical protein